MNKESLSKFERKITAPLLSNEKKVIEHNPEETFQFYNSAFLPNRNYEEMKTRSKSLISVQLNSINPTNFKEVVLRNKLALMGLDLNRCSVALSALDFETSNLEQLVTDIVDQYFREEIKTNNDEFLLPHEDFVISFLKPKKDFSYIKSDDSGDIDPFAPKKQCPICYEDRLESHFKEIPSNKHSFCVFCLETYLTTAIHSNNILNIKCPDNCSKSLDERDIQILLQNNETLYQKYNKFKRIAELSKKPGICWCSRPGCENYMEGSSKKPKLICALCGQMICFFCKNDWHEGLKCEEAMNKEFKLYQNNFCVKECPSCHHGIEKVDGCNHMTCGKCHFEFCWLCGGHYSSKHYEWYNIFGCPGMQYSHLDRRGLFRIYLERVARVLCFIFILPIIIAGLAIGLPLALVLTGLFGPLIKYRENNMEENCGVKEFFIQLLIFLLSIVFLPLSVLLLIFPGSCIILRSVHNEDEFFQ